MELSLGNKMLLDDYAYENASLPRDSFYFLSSSTFYALYLDIFAHNAMHVPNSFELHFALLESNKVQTNYKVHIEEKENIFSQQSNHSCAQELGITSTSRFQIMSSINTPRSFEESCSCHNQPVETKVCNETNNVFNSRHSIYNMPILMRNDSSHTSFHSIHSLQVDYEGYEPHMNFQEKETLSRIILTSLFLEFIYESNHIVNINILSQDYFHKIFVHDPHRIGYSSAYYFKQSYVINCTYYYYDRIAYWLEDSYREKFLENGKVTITLFVNEDQGDKYNVFPFHFELLQFLLLILDFVFFAGLKLLRWFHWKHDFT
jgi:hypothetical protein